MWKLRVMKSMSFTVFSYNATVLLIQPNPTHHMCWKMRPNQTQPMDGLNSCPSLWHFQLLFIQSFVVNDKKCLRCNFFADSLKTDVSSVYTAVTGAKSTISCRSSAISKIKSSLRWARRQWINFIESNTAFGDCKLISRGIPRTVSTLFTNYVCERLTHI